VPDEFNDKWLFEKILFPNARAGSDAVMSLYKDKMLVQHASAVETFYEVAPDTCAATRNDPSLEANLQRVFGLSLDQVASYHWEEFLGRVKAFWSFNHSWALRPWAEHILSQTPGRTVVLRFDAHDDLASPMIGVTEAKGVFSAPIGTAALDLNHRSAIEEFVLRGFVGIGSFIVPLLHASSEIEIVHVAREHSAIPEELALVAEVQSERLFTGRLFHRPTVRLAGPSDETKLRYTRTSEVSQALKRAQDRNYVLDIDLDYICNALDNKRRETRSSSSEHQWAEETARVLDDVGHLVRAARIVPSLVTIALSPGFFPSEGWTTTLPRLREIISDL
jgi:hypothetical protein